MKARFPVFAAPPADLAATWPHVSVILPAYNEAQNIVPLIHALKRHLRVSHEILVMDDNSPDGTARAASDAFANDPTIKVHVRTADRGLARSIRDGILRSTGTKVIVMDTDFNHDPGLVGRFVELSASYDMVIGSRFCAGGGMENVWRYYCSLIFSLCLVRPLLRTSVRDTLCGYYLIDGDTLRALPLEQICYGYGDYFFRLLWHAESAGCRLHEIPVYYRLRPTGQSKSNLVALLLSYSWEALKISWTARRPHASGQPARR